MAMLIRGSDLESEPGELSKDPTAAKVEPSEASRVSPPGPDGQVDAHLTRRPLPSGVYLRASQLLPASRRNTFLP